MIKVCNLLVTKNISTYILFLFFLILIYFCHPCTHKRVRKIKLFMSLELMTVQEEVFALSESLYRIELNLQLVFFSTTASSSTNSIFVLLIWGRNVHFGKEKKQCCPNSEQHSVCLWRKNLLNSILRLP